jgi:hypothetical protein
MRNRNYSANSVTDNFFFKKAECVPNGICEKRKELWVENGFFYVSHLLQHGTSVPVILTSDCRALGEGAITTYFKRLRFDAAGTSGTRTHDLPFAKREHYH